MLSVRRFGRRMPAAAVAVATAALLSVVPTLTGGPAARAAQPSCPWLSPATGDFQARAAAVVAAMSLERKASYIAIQHRPGTGYENYLPAEPDLCLPSLRLEDGPAGVAYGAARVTQLPAPIALSSTWDPRLAAAYGTVIGQEARAKGVNVAQAPMLNLARVPQGGRDFEGFGEDPTLVTAMADPEIEAIQSQGVIAEAKHFVANDQESQRTSIDEKIGRRTLEEVYLPPFESAVRDAHVGSIMCAFNKINSVYACQSRWLLTGVLRDRLGFKGFVRSDMGAAHDLTQTLTAGDDMVKPLTVDQVVSAVNSGKLSIRDVNRAVTNILTPMFAIGLINRPVPESPYDNATTPAHRGIAAQVAEAGTVLLQNRSVHGSPVLPLTGRDQRSVAVIGTGAWSAPQLAGGGSSQVTPSRVVTPVEGLVSGSPRGARIRYAAGSRYRWSPTPVPAQVQTTDGSTRGVTEVVTTPGRPAVVVHARQVAADFGTPSQPRAPHRATPGNFTANWRGQLDVARTGVYRIGLDSDDGGTITVDGKTLVTRRSGNVGPRPVWLVAGHPVPFTVTYIDRHPGGSMQLVWGPARDPGRSPAAAAQLAARSRVAIVFASNIEGEGYDRHSLSLPGDQNQLIERVAQRNPRTVVVLDTGGPVLMPWLSKVAAVVQAWYPGELDGQALDAVLTGRVDPSGKLPMTFPASSSQVPTSSPRQWPGVNGVAHYSEGLYVGYRWYIAHHVRPLFPFGFGLSYTSFRVSQLSVSRRSAGGAQVGVTVRNTGHRSGATVVQAYLRYPRSAHEPPESLKAFQKVSVRPGSSVRVRIQLPPSAFDYWTGRTGWRRAEGRYVVSVGQSSDDLPLHASVPAPWASPR